MSTLVNANLATRCQHTKMNGSPCAAPARRGQPFCIFHEPAHSSDRPDYSLAVIEDATSLQFGTMQVMRALNDHAIEHKTAALMLYGLQIAASNLKRFAAEQPDAAPDREPSFAQLLLERLGLDEELEREREHEEFARETGALREPNAQRLEPREPRA